jgi:peptidoglycan/LPS O-acetylase OafA/YrhL
MRIHGFDLLRGLCAIAVALYHMLHWSAIAELHTWGLFGVYIFFALSGASLVVGYRDHFARGMPASHFLAMRFARLAPLYVLVVLLNAYALFHNVVGARIGLLNATLLFGLGNAGATSLATGGWSLGIEFAFYLMFPVLLSLAISRARYWIGGIVALAQLAFVHLVVGGAPDLTSAWQAYTQPLAFIGYFYLGCVIGHDYLEGRVSRITPLAFCAVMALILVSSGDNARHTLTGRGGVGLFALSIAAVYLASGLRLEALMARCAAFLGNASYGVYLMHPLVYKALGQLELGAVPRILLTLALSLGLAHASYRLYESPIRSLVRKRLPRFPIRSPEPEVSRA